MSTALQLTEEKVQVLMAGMLKMPQAVCPLEHLFAPGLYIKHITFPKDTVIIGGCHTGPQLNIMLSGKIALIAPTGETTILDAPQVFVGSKDRKIAVSLSEVRWMNVYATDETNIDKLDALFTEKEAHELLVTPQQLELELEAS